jgi:hypothetical protein
VGIGLTKVCLKGLAICCDFGKRRMSTASEELRVRTTLIGSKGVRDRRTSRVLHSQPQEVKTEEIDGV